MLLQVGSRESGVEFAVGCFLLALGIGLLIPRPGIGLYSLLHGNSHLWAALLLLSAWLLILGSTNALWRVIALFKVKNASRTAATIRLANVILAMAAWTMLAFKFVDGGLWGATMQAVMAIFLLNACAFRLFYYLRRAHGD